MIAEGHGERNLPAGNLPHHCLHSLFYRLSIDHITRKYHEIRLFNLQYLTDTLQCDVRAGVVRDIMHVGELDNLEFALAVEVHPRLGECRDYRGQCQ